MNRISNTILSSFLSVLCFGSAVAYADGERCDHHSHHQANGNNSYYNNTGYNTYPSQYQNQYPNQNYSNNNYGYTPPANTTPSPQYAAQRPVGTVTDSKPIYEWKTREVPREKCQTVQIQDRYQRGVSREFGTVVGAGAGALLGSQIGRGRGRTAATIAGGVVGAAVGSSVTGNQPRSTTVTRDEQRCETVYETRNEQVLVGYDVKYTYLGQNYSTRTTNAPGATIPLEVSVRAATE